MTRAAGQLRSDVSLSPREEHGIESWAMPEIVLPFGYRTRPEIAAFGEWNTTNLGDRAIHAGVQEFFSGCGWHVQSYGFGSLVPVPAEAPLGNISFHNDAGRKAMLAMMPAVGNALRGVRQGYRMMQLLPQLKRAQAILVGGGALLSGEAGRHFPRSLALLAAVAGRLGKPLYCLGCSAEGNWAGASGRNIINFLAACTVVAARDAASAERIAAVLRRPVPVFGDFCLSDIPASGTSRGLREERGIAINVCRLPARWSGVQEHYEGAMVAFADRLMRSPGGRSLNAVTVFTTGAQGDADPARRVCASLATRKAELLFPRNLGHLSGLLSSSGLVIASRLHAAILGLVAGALVVSFSPTPKLRNFFETVGIGNYSFGPDDGEGFPCALDTADYAAVLDAQHAALARAPFWACRERIRRQFRAASGAGSAPVCGDQSCK
jgi:polysaccharide pyruvyl transferase WcaK-like protein